MISSFIRKILPELLFRELGKKRKGERKQRSQDQEGQEKKREVKIFLFI